jgi:lysophospholipase L1-like esterase
MRILFFGDSITQGFWSVDGGWVEKIRKHYDGISMQDLDHNIQPEIFNLGISGDTTRNLLRRIEGEILARKWKHDPLIVVIAIGSQLTYLHRLSVTLPLQRTPCLARRG